jgi:hypothetical protein
MLDSAWLHPLSLTELNITSKISEGNRSFSAISLLNVIEKEETSAEVGREKERVREVQACRDRGAESAVYFCRYFSTAWVRDLT